MKDKFVAYLAERNFDRCGSKRTPAGHYLSITLGDKHITFEWRDRGGLREGWFQSHASYTKYGLAKLKQMVKAYSG